MRNNMWHCPRDPFCECCGDLEAYDLIFADHGGTTWCETCIANGVDDIPEGLLEAAKYKYESLKRISRKNKIEWHLDELARLWDDEYTGGGD